MSDVVVTVPKWFWPEWIAEGDAAGEPESGERWVFYLHTLPSIQPGERVYIVAHGKLRGYSPLVRVAETGLIRKGGAVAVTIDEPIKGFQGFRYRWWKQEDEKPFPNWREP
jgi:hypothetical protein